MHIKKLKQDTPDWLGPIWETIEKYYSADSFKKVESGSFAVGLRENYKLGESKWMHVIGRPAPEEILDTISLDLGFRYFTEGVITPPLVVDGKLTQPLVDITGGYDFDHFVPDKYIQLLRAFNGLNLFGSFFSISGVMSVSANNRFSIHGDLPIGEGELTCFNIYDRPKQVAPKVLFIGGYYSNGSVVYLKENTETVYCCDHEGKTLKTWPSIESWIALEVERLSNFFDEKGNYITAMGPSHPT